MMVIMIDVEIVEAPVESFGLFCGPILFKEKELCVSETRCWDAESGHRLQGRSGVTLGKIDFAEGSQLRGTVLHE